MGLARIKRNREVQFSTTFTCYFRLLVNNKLQENFKNYLINKFIYRNIDINAEHKLLKIPGSQNLWTKNSIISKNLGPFFSWRYLYRIKIWISCYCLRCSPIGPIEFQKKNYFLLYFILCMKNSPLLDIYEELIF